MKRYKVIVLPAAKDDERAILKYLLGISGYTARYYHKLFAEKFRSLAEFPLRCPPAKNEKYAKLGYHYLVINYYLAFFTVEGDTVKIQRIFDGRSDYTAQI